MRLVVQKVSRAEVRVDGGVVGKIGHGLLVLVGVERGDGPTHADRAADRLATLRVFEDDQGRLNRGLDDVGGELMVVSQFTLAGSIRRGRRPSLDGAAPAAEAEPLVERLVDALRARGCRVATGVFRAHMEVELVNDGPVTFVWDERPDALPR